MTDEQAEALSVVADEMYDIAAKNGFHETDGDDTVIEVVARYVANAHGEISELWEAARRDELAKPCDKPIPLTCEEEEIADIIIRAMDYAGQATIDIGKAIKIKSEYNRTRPRMHNKLA